MPVEIDTLASRIEPEKSILFFGAGASIPSNAPSVSKLISALSKKFGIDSSDYELSEITEFICEDHDRRDLIRFLRESLKNVRPSGGMLNLPLYNWKSIYTTNYDNVVEESYRRKGKDLKVYTSNFDFDATAAPSSQKLFKIHGTLEKDKSFGDASKIVITESDYQDTEEYRDYIYDRLKSDLSDSHLIIIGYSLSDPAIKEIVERALRIKKESASICKIYLFMFKEDNNRARMLESKGVTVCFGGIDSFFNSLSRYAPDTDVVYSTDSSTIEKYPDLVPVTFVVENLINSDSNVSAMYNGSAATYADISSKMTFERTIVDLLGEKVNGEGPRFYTILGASGVGKTTAARQLVKSLYDRGFDCFEHNSDYDFNPDAWLAYAKSHGDDRKTVVFVDDAHSYLNKVNILADRIAVDGVKNLYLILASVTNQWLPRVKSPSIFRLGIEKRLERLDRKEIESLISLVESNSELNRLAEESFSGFSRYERRRRLVDRCDSDMFVCLKNIFASEKFDDIILREYSELDDNSQEIYRLVAAMENAGVRVHRQLVIRMLNVDPSMIPVVLAKLTDIVTEYTVSEREGIYGWKGRHSIIVGIIAKYKFDDKEELYKLFESVIDAISPTYEIEIRSIRELCSVDGGIHSIPDKGKRNHILRRMMSVAPGERLPRHRLIRNLIEMGEFDKAETEIRIFEKDFRRDPSVERYKVKLMVERAQKTNGLMLEDRRVILQHASELAETLVERYSDNKYVLSSFCDVGIAMCELSGCFEIIDRSLEKLKEAETRVGDPDISRYVIKYERKLASLLDLKA
ncbi:SIR2 family protein [Halomonas korlensis]|uniref:SIR2-like domain-containing protein n=1 Tax=Halomonas korlensis TaxID=463301 RepID=A0A1I7ILQ3_9GAMM|nr:SIR2 family protein [Halomonas korlensis]SFU73825.1 SIR2-like domain-containing protein [Halomonas korlensis]